MLSVSDQDRNGKTKWDELKSGLKYFLETISADGDLADFVKISAVGYDDLSDTLFKE